jgi:hypothetical protein
MLSLPSYPIPSTAAAGQGGCPMFSSALLAAGPTGPTNLPADMRRAVSNVIEEEEAYEVSSTSELIMGPTLPPPAVSIDQPVSID